MPSEYRPRTHPLMNPEVVATLLRQLVLAWDGDDREAFTIALDDARRLLGLSAPAPEPPVTSSPPAAPQ